ncbi:zinc finger protein no ocelli [Arctopsyche grandis]|uniref:zinc finger protein no ocelli n=1 Tax=Arctopsyche grandis TaxID=121162 RepID=UPI00406D7856
MVVLEGGGMLSSGGNQYLQPDYLSPLPTTLDAKKSPLALLAQTCSQIGADSPSSKSLALPQDKKKNATIDVSNRTPPAKQEKPRTTPEIRHLAFKPYETNVLTKKVEEVRPSSKASSDSGEERKSGKATPGRKSSTPLTTTTPALDGGKSSPSTSDRKTSSPAGSSGRGASPIIRSGLEVLQGHPKDMPLGTFKPGMGLGSLCCPPGLEQHNPAFRPPFAGAPFTHQHSAMGSYPASPYLGYARVKTPAGGDALVPVCKDPYCTGCQVSLHGQQLLMGGMPGCPAGCTQCDHHKYSLAMAMALSPTGSLPPSALAYAQLGRPYVCNWIAGESYCGKRFGTSEELLQHLRSHTAEGGAPGSSPLSPGFPVLGRYPGAPLSPLSAARFHPYAKPGLPLGSPYGFSPALGPYYSPYALYGQRLGAAHQ